MAWMVGVLGPEGGDSLAQVSEVVYNQYLFK